LGSERCTFKYGFSASYTDFLMGLVASPAEAKRFSRKRKYFHIMPFVLAISQ